MDEKHDETGNQPADEQEKTAPDIVEDLEPEPDESVKITGGAAKKSYEQQ